MPDPKLIQIILAAKDITGAALTKFRGRIAAITKSVFSFRGALGALTGAGGFGLLINKSVDAADAIGKTADKLGIGTTALQEYRYAAERSGVATNTLDMALQRFTRRVAEAAQEKGELRGVLEQYNIAVRDAAGNTRRIQDVFRDLADVIQRTRDPSERLRIAFKAFDSGGAALVNMLRDGSAGLDQFAGKARDLGIILDNDLIRGSERARDAMDDLSKVIQTSFSRVVLENVESLTAGIEALAATANFAATAFGKMDKWLNTTIGGQLGTSVKEQYLNDLETRSAALRKHIDTVQNLYQLPGDKELLKPLLQQYDLMISKIKIIKGELVDRELTRFFADLDRIPAGQATARAARAPIAPRGRAAGVPANFDQTWGPGELSRFAQYDVLVRDSEQAYDKMTDHVKEYTDYTAETYEMLDQRVSTTFSHASDALADFATTAKLDFTSFANSLISDLVRIQSRMLLTGLFQSAAGLFGGGGLPTTIRGGQGGGYGFQGGGHIGEGVRGVGLRSGRSYEFHANETVIPDSRLAAAGGGVVINNYSGQPATARERTDVNGIRKIFVEIGNDIIRNGPVGQAIKMRYGLAPVGKPI